MRLTKLGHSCVRLEKDGATLVIDPGGWSGQGVLDGADTVLVTHEHPDHLDADVIRAALESNRDLQLWSNESAASKFAEFGDRVHVVAHGDEFSTAGFDVRVYGRDHAVIVPAIPVIPNTGFLVDGEVFHPGDSFTVPGEKVGTLLVPVSAPWLKFAEVAEYIAAVGADRGYAIHDAVLSPEGLGLIGMLLGIVSPPDAAVTRLDPGTAVEV
jgi:L-ascorbate metabolism protein UlaG (beta-lactamase superfamily)